MIKQIYSKFFNQSSKSIFKFSTTKFAGYSQCIYQKVNVTRLPFQAFTFYIDINDKVSTLFQHLEKMFPQSKFIATSKFQSKLGQPITQQQIKQSQDIKKIELVEVLLHSNILVYEKKNDFYDVCLGIQLKQYHPTNNRNVFSQQYRLQLPQHIAQNIIKLSQTWKTNRSVEFALSKDQPYNQAEHQEEIKQIQSVFKQVQENYQNYLALCKFYKNQFLQIGKARQLMANMIALMSFNWVFLFAVTYGKYGWDVGEPLSYLATLAVELIAMLEIFSMNEAVEKTGKQDWATVTYKMNLESLLRSRQFLIAYNKRHF